MRRTQWWNVTMAALMVGATWGCNQAAAPEESVGEAQAALAASDAEDATQPEAETAAIDPASRAEVEAEMVAFEACMRAHGVDLGGAGAPGTVIAIGEAADDLDLEAPPEGAGRSMVFMRRRAPAEGAEDAAAERRKVVRFHEALDARADGDVLTVDDAALAADPARLVMPDEKMHEALEACAPEGRFVKVAITDR